MIASKQYDKIYTYVGDPHLRSIEQESSINSLGRRLHAHNIGTGRVLRHGQGTNLLTRDQAREVLGFLFRVGIQRELVDAELGVGGVGKGNAACHAKKGV